MDSKVYKVKFVKYEVAGGHVAYTVKIVDSKGSEAFHIKDRYSSMRSFWKNMVAEFDKAVPPSFPPKKWFGNKEAEFIKRRMEELEHFFNSLLEDPKLASSNVTQTYFTRKKVAEKPASPPRAPAPQPTSAAPMARAVAAPVGNVAPVPNDMAWRQIVDKITKTYIDISSWEEPPPVAEIRKKSQAYSEAASSTLGAVPYISKILHFPRGDDQASANLNLDQASNELAMCDWLDSKMEILSKLVQNQSRTTYAEESIYFPFKISV
jgi:hypothetical protein